ncbi:pks15/1 [Symbiodinium sp. CCMP2592]|nr:pks15/1 [Symbiodinium sp. CCMP2592]
MERISKVFKPKVSGAWHLHEDLNLGSFVGFSSASALMELSRGTSYSASNAYLDGLGLWRQKAVLPFFSVQWGSVAEVGMASKDHSGQADSALRQLPPGHVQATFGPAIVGNSNREWPLPSLCFAQVEWGRFLRELGAEIAILEEFAGEEETAIATGTATAALPAAVRGLGPEQLEAKRGQVVQRIALGILGVDELTADDPLMEELQGLKLPSTQMFDHPTTKAIAAFATEQLAAMAAAPPPLPATAAPMELEISFPRDFDSLSFAQKEEFKAQALKEILERRETAVILWAVSSYDEMHGKLLQRLLPRYQGQPKRLRELCEQCPGLRVIRIPTVRIPGRSSW